MPGSVCTRAVAREVAFAQAKARGGGVSSRESSVGGTGLSSVQRGKERADPLPTAAMWTEDRVSPGRTLVAGGCLTCVPVGDR